MSQGKILYDLDLSEWESSDNLAAANIHKQRLVKGLAVFCLLIFIPFSIHNYLHERWPLLIINLLFLAAFVPSMWYMFREGKPLPTWVIVLVTTLLVLATSIPIAYHGLVSVLWAFTITTAFYFLLSRQLAFAMSLVVLLCYGGVSIYSLEPYPAIRVLIALVVNFYLVSLLARKIQRAQFLLSELANKDAMTGALNRRLLDDYLNESLGSYERNAKRSVVAIFDIDFFKKINDERGHQAGDVAIVELVKLIKENSRKSDMVFRLGGDEMLLLIRDVSIVQAQEMLERIRARIESCDVIGTSSSVGAVCCSLANSYDNWINQADEALYRAKSLGRNRVVLMS
ncbi:GGDEF domain-containing protein [uncultured Pseudoteredinibacter sp.]|uniref:GGDEF domain-containing protein n=1 Tax=uncultured Pseudoteredinibacter sp. TaxID=1641701 RepID=UPI002622A35A|nr:GGDEF domain-containing protein [uncultured Pseudoteredinibacter sp.]